jgi:uncharacterized protein YjbJ (UPF0337 family)
MIRGISAITLAFTTFAVASAVNGADPAAKSTAAKSIAAKSTAAKVPTIPAIEKDAKKALALQWLQWQTKPVPWETCLGALGVAIQGGAKFPEALAILGSGYDGKSKAKNPYAVPAEDADAFWDWLAGAVENDKDLSDDAKLVAALADAKTFVDSFYRTNSQALMEKVDANFLAKSPRVAIFQLLAYAANDTRKAMEKVAAKQKQADASDSLATQKRAEAEAALNLHTQIDTIADSITGISANLTNRTTQDSSDLKSTVATDVGAIKSAASGNPAAIAAADQLARHVQGATDASSASLKALIGQLTDADKNALKGAVDKYSADAQDKAKAAKDQHTADMGAVDQAGKELDASLRKLESIRLCYASVDKGVNNNVLNYRKKLSDYVAGKFHRTGS